ncbi:B-cell receptor CD22 isoform X1 [Brienomyrus brachyistius]|uniref:B-cell receptor CD22 isoform X1 n=2 Tax=Brienomyrus brachyistius TaxID=42636 RepID=UPI0020B44977|nr:B-cell receptor CD22 isoform X1 [Brienomyrus brachyistius]
MGHSMMETTFFCIFTCTALSGVLGNKWWITMPTTELCVWTSTTASLSCQYNYPYGYRVTKVMWYRVTADGKQEYAFHSDLNLVSPTYKGRTRYSNRPKSCLLEIFNSRTTDNGEYYFRFETNHPKGKQTFTNSTFLSVTDLQVQVHPARAGNVFASGETIYLSCIATGCASRGTTFVLYRNATRLELSNPLIIYNFDQKHAGTYACHAESSPSIQSLGIILSVGYAPRFTTVEISPQSTIPEGSSVMLTCNSDADPAVETYSWFKDGDNWSLPDSFKPELHLRKVLPSDLGDYYCTAQNSLGREKSRPVLLNVTYAPRSTSVSISPPVDIMEGSSVTLNCNSNANPPVQNYSWFQIIGSKLYERGFSQNLAFTSVRAQDSGQYYCTVHNQHGQDTSFNRSLVILYTPKNTSVSIQPSGDIETGSSVTLTCSSNANPAVENYTWFRINEADLWEIRSGPTYTISRITHREGGKYYCEASNRLGRHRSPVLLVQVRGRLKVIALVSAVGVSVGLITLTVFIMISKNMHVVENKLTEDAQQVSSEQMDMFQETMTEKFEMWKLKARDMLEEPENVYENTHPTIIPLKDVTPNSEGDEDISYVTVHFTKNLSQDRKVVLNPLLASAAEDTDVINPELVRLTKGL